MVPLNHKKVRLRNLIQTKVNFRENIIIKFFMRTHSVRRPDL
jgi:hypothetical protein